LEILPNEICVDNIYYPLVIGKCGVGYGNEYESIYYCNNKNLSDALAEMVCKLREEGII
jgi:hypothetical protein